MSLLLELGELASDVDFLNKVTDLKMHLDKISAVVNQGLENRDKYDKLTPAQQVDYDLFMAFALNSLYWMHLRLQGVDPTTHPIKNELSRIRAAMLRHKEAVERTTIRPTLNKEAAQRFVRSGLWQPKENEEAEPKNKKIKFNEDGTVKKK